MGSLLSLLRGCKREDELGAIMASQRRIAANRRNWSKRRGLTESWRQRLREAAGRFGKAIHFSGNPGRIPASLVSEDDQVDQLVVWSGGRPGHVGTRCGVFFLDRDLTIYKKLQECIPMRSISAVGVTGVPGSANSTKSSNSSNT